MAVVFATPVDLLGHDGAVLGTSDWIVVDQARIDLFADATLDHQWIHTDPARAAAGPFGGTIAHGYLTLSLVNHFLPQIIDVRGFKMGVNVGCEQIRFLSPVKSGARIRGTGILLRADPAKGNAVQSVVRVTIEIEGEGKPACIVDTISRYYPE